MGRQQVREQRSQVASEEPRRRAPADGERTGLYAAVADSPVMQARRKTLQLMFGGRAAVRPASALKPLPPLGAPPAQRNPFLQSLANAGNQIDYGVISAAAAHTPGWKLWVSISTAMERNLRRQGVFEALENAGYGAEFETYAGNNGWPIETVVGMGQDIRSSHSGGAIDPGLPQPAYETVPVGGGGQNVSVAKPVRATLADRANWQWLKSTTTDHTTDPDQPGLRGPTSPRNAPTLGSIVGGGVGPNLRLPANNKRVASYFELGAHNIHDNIGDVTGVRVVYNPFNGQHFVSEHYATEYELINTPAANTFTPFGLVTARINATLNHPNYLANPGNHLLYRQRNIYRWVLSEIQNGFF